MRTSRTGREHQLYDGKKRLVVCAVTISTDKNKVIMISSSKDATQWILPKGGWEADETQQECALRELEEEAGIQGIIHKELGSIDYKTNKGKYCQLFGYAIHVMCELAEWSESATRRREWVDITEAKARLASRKELLTMLERATM